MNLKKIMLAMLASLMVGCASIASAEVTVVDANLRKDCVNGTSYLVSQDGVKVFENDNLKVELSAVLLDGFSAWGKGSLRKQFLDAHEDAVVHFWQAALDGQAWWLTPTRTVLAFTNKSREKMAIDFSRSVVSIGGYTGTPIIDKRSSVLNLEPDDTGIAILTRNDMIIVKRGPGIKDVAFPSDLSISKNILGKGDFNFCVSIGDSNAEYVPMHFDKRINRTAIFPYVKKVQKG